MKIKVPAFFGGMAEVEVRGWKIVEEGLIQKGDKYWSPTQEGWTRADKRVWGDKVQEYFCVIRKEGQDETN